MRAREDLKRLIFPPAIQPRVQPESNLIQPDQQIHIRVMDLRSISGDKEGAGGLPRELSVSPLSSPLHTTI